MFWYTVICHTSFLSLATSIILWASSCDNGTYHGMWSIWILVNSALVRSDLISFLSVNLDLITSQFGPREYKVRIDQHLSGVEVRIDQGLSGVKVQTDQSLSAVKVRIDQHLYLN